MLMVMSMNGHCPEASRLGFGQVFAFLCYAVFKVLYVLYNFLKLIRKFYGMHILTGQKVNVFKMKEAYFPKVPLNKKEPFT